MFELKNDQAIPIQLYKHLGCQITFGCCDKYAPDHVQGFIATIGTFRSEDEDDYEYEFSVLSKRTSKNVGLQTLCACSVRKTRTCTRPRPPI